MVVVAGVVDDEGVAAAVVVEASGVVIETVGPGIDDELSSAAEHAARATTKPAVHHATFIGRIIDRITTK